MAHTTLGFSFFGISVAVTTDSDRIAQWLAFDFSRFSCAAPAAADVTAHALLQDPTSVPMPAVPETSHSPEFVTYRSADTRWIDYYGQALAVYERSLEQCHLYALDEALLYEKVYLFIMSRIGERLDSQGLHRVHAMGFSLGGKGVLYLIPMRGGKSTLALRLRTVPDFRLLSDDSPIITDTGLIRPFPIRLGVLAGEAPHEIAAHHVRRFERAGKTAKDLIHPDALGGLWADADTECAAVIIGRWTKAAAPSITPVSRFTIFRALLRDCVIGYGLPQVVEFFLRLDVADLFGKTKLVFTRSLAAWKIAARSHGYRIDMTSDHDANITLLTKTLQSRTSQ